MSIRNRRDGKIPRYTHSHWELEYKGVKAICSKDGKVTLTQEHDDDSYDEVIVTANMIFRLVQMLSNKEGEGFKISQFELNYKGVKAEYIPENKIKFIKEHHDDTYDEVETEETVIFKLASMLNASKNIEFVEREEAGK